MYEAEGMAEKTFLVLRLSSVFRSHFLTPATCETFALMFGVCSEVAGGEHGQTQGSGVVRTWPLKSDRQAPILPLQLPSWWP